MLRKLHVFLRMPPGDRRLFVQAWFLLLTVDLSLRMLGFARTRRNFNHSRLNLKPMTAAQSWAVILHHQDLVDLAANRHLYPMTCLRTALVLAYLLECRGIDTEMRIGVEKDYGKLGAHAWLEYAGQPIGEPANIAEVLPPLTTFPEAHS